MSGPTEAQVLAALHRCAELTVQECERQEGFQVGCSDWSPNTKAIARQIRDELYPAALPSSPPAQDEA